jgi:hypothetical protein
MSEFLGSLQQLAGFSGHARMLAVYDSALVIARGSDLAALGRLVGGAPGAALGRRDAKRKSEKAGTAMTPTELADAHKNNELIPIDSVKRASLRKTKMRLYRELTLELTDGTTKSGSWQPGHNKDKASVPLLRTALGDKLDAF